MKTFALHEVRRRNRHFGDKLTRLAVTKSWPVKADGVPWRQGAKPTGCTEQGLALLPLSAKVHETEVFAACSKCSVISLGYSLSYKYEA